ncbi:MAG: hypothetical protein U0904_11705 [Candidatus Nanopelagicales bacterium]|nr:hypothetical protein [Candidatus Nanopelagicales bacterium]
MTASAGSAARYEVDRITAEWRQERPDLDPIRKRAFAELAARMSHVDARPRRRR